VWQATLAGYQTSIKVEGDDLSFALSSRAGEFRGHRDRKTNAIGGFWIQPPGEIFNNKYVTPIELKSLAPSVWRGPVAPLDPPFAVYLSIAASQTGKLTATVANPEMNLLRGRIFTVTRTGSKVRLETDGSGFDGSYDDKTDTLSLPLMEGLPPLSFSRRDRNNAVEFFARAPSESIYQYRRPVEDGDGWTTASLAGAGMDETPVRELVQRILESDPAGNSLNIQSLLISRHGRLVVEEYFHGFHENRPHDMRSASKTFAPVLVGLARRHGAKIAPETRVYPLFSRYTAFQNADVRKQAMTLRDLMTMTAGNACDDNDDNSPGNEDTMQGDPRHADWYKYTLDLPMVKQPGGEDAVYCSGNLNLVGGAAAIATGAWLPELFQRYLAGPLQFGRYYLNLMPDGQAYMGGGAYLRPRDQLKLGQLFLNGGTWNGRRLLSKSWVAESMASHSHFDPRWSLGARHEYGYGWHINFLKSGSKIYRAVAAGGNGGQFVIVVPELDLVIGINGGSYGEFAKWYRWELELVPQYILASVRRP
jgi:CubicO group peptidase (beta-lactamase class C family)